MFRKTLTDVNLLYRNFSGKAGMYSPEGTRTFAIALSEDQAEEMAAEGWNVKPAIISESGVASPLLKVTLPTLSLFALDNITLDGEPISSEKDLSLLDTGTSMTGTISVLGFPWKIAGRSGIKTFLVSIDAKTGMQ